MHLFSSFSSNPESQSGGTATRERFSSAMVLYLLQFVHRHLDFRLAELDALLQMSGCDPGDVYDRAAVD
eukprot:4550025-Prorocentrum_lima.AAC.1